MNKRSYRYDNVRYSCSSGSPFSDEYKTVSKNGVEEVECVGQIPLDQLIQADADACTIKNIVKRFTEGDAAALNARAAQYMDLTGAPSNLLEAQAQLARAEAYFKNLPIDVQGEYSFDFKRFIESTADGSFINKFGETLGLVKPRNKEVTENAGE